MEQENKKQTENIFKNKVIALGLTGGLAAYKICLLINKFRSLGASIRLIATENSLNFITKTTLQTLARTPVLTEQFDIKKYDINHKSLQAEADLFILAPASANTISKVANGIADNLLTSVLCAWQKPLLIAPAMNDGMWYNPSTQNSIKTLEARGAFIVGPQIAKMSNGQVSKGPMAEVSDIFESAKNILSLEQTLKDKKVLIIGGSMREDFDNTNFISVKNTCDKARFLARAAYLNGAKVVLISDDICEVPYPQIKAQTRTEYKEAILKNIEEKNVLIFASNMPTWQIVKEEKETKKLVLTLTPTQDFIKEVLPKKSKDLLVLDFHEKDFDTQNPMQTAFDLLKEIK